MKKIYTVLFLLLAFSFKGVNQTYTINPTGYIPFSNANGSPISLSGTQNSALIPIGFTFNYFGNNYTHFVISPNNYLSFDASLAGASSAVTIVDAPNVSLPHNAIFFPLQNLTPWTSGVARIFQFGSAPNRSLTVEFDSIKSSGTCSPWFQSSYVTIWETSNVIQITIFSKHYCGPAIEGITNSTGTIAYVMPARNASDTWGAGQESYFFIPSGSTFSAGYNLIKGRLYEDINQNCMFDGGDQPLAGTIVINNGAGQISTNPTDGTYQLLAGQGPHVLSSYVYATPNVTISNICPATNQLMVSFPSVGDSITGQDFADSSFICFNNSVYPNFAFCRRCHLVNHHTISISNYNPIIATGHVLEWIKPSTLIPFQFSQSPISVNGDTFLFNVPTLQPGTGWVILIQDSILCSTALGDPLHFEVNNPTFPLQCNNTFNHLVCNEIVIGSCDPNDKMVATLRNYDQGFQFGTTAFITDTLEYQVRFQNTGNDTAFNIVVRDTLPNYLDASTIELLGASHQFSFLRNNNVLVWTFDNINLPDSFVNSAASNASLKFRVRMNSSVPLGTVIHNTAEIKFDYNGEIQTNDALVTVVDPNGIREISTGDFILYPNPANDVVSFALNHPSSGPIISCIFNANGKLMTSKISDQYYNSFDLENFRSGIYFLQIKDTKGNLFTKSFAKF